MAKRIGVLGGISHESTAKYYSLIHEKYYARRGDYHYPEVVVYSLDFQRFTDHERARITMRTGARNSLCFTAIEMGVVKIEVTLSRSGSAA